DGRLDQVDRDGAAVDLGQAVLHAAGLEHLAHPRPALHTSTRAGPPHDHLAGPVTAADPVRDGLLAHPAPRLPLDRLARVLERLLDGRRHLVGLAVAVGHAAVLVADDDEGVEAEPPAALDHRGAAADLHHIVVEAVRPALTFFRHRRVSLSPRVALRT